MWNDYLAPKWVSLVIFEPWLEIQFLILSYVFLTIFIYVNVKSKTKFKSKPRGFNCKVTINRGVIL